MQTLVIVAHPDFDNSGTQNFLRASSAHLPQVQYHVLDQLYPDYQVDVARERQLLQAADQIIFQFPLYWYSAPASLKAWLDQVLQTAQEERLPDYQGKALGLVVSTGVAAAQFTAGRSEQFTLSEILRPYQALAHKLHLTYRAPLIISQFSHTNDLQKAQLLVQYQQYLTSFSDHFADQVRWLAQRLQDLASRNPEEPALAAVAATLTANQDHLDDLNQTIAMMKGGGSIG